MAREYGKRNSARRHSGSVSKQLLLVLVCFLLGYLSASIFDFTSLSGWVNTQILAQHRAPTTIKPTQQAQLPKPKFEFYTLLASEHNTATEQVHSAPAAVVATTNGPVVNAGTPAAAKYPPLSAPLANVVSGKPLPIPAAVGKGGYLVQIAAFKSRQEADRMKASLVLKGFAVNIAAVNQHNVNWYRVSIGPFASRPEAQKAQLAVARSERIVGMIRKMDA